MVRGRGGSEVRRRGGFSVRTLVSALVLQLVLGGALIAVVASDYRVFGISLLSAGPGPTVPTPVPRARVDRFDEHRAFSELRAQVALGPRPAGSAVLHRLAARLRRELPHGRLESVAGQPGLVNVVGRVPGRRPAIVLAAHYDTKVLPGTGAQGANAFVGANDGAAGTAAVVEVSRALRARPRRNRREIDFVLFDGEESPPGAPDFYASGDRGSKAYLAAHRLEIKELILLDFIANRDLRLPREAGSNLVLWQALRAAARRVGVGMVFPDRSVSEIQDDHTPFARAGIPAIDLIDFDYPCFHRLCDTPGFLSARGLDAAGEATTELLLQLR